MSKSSETETAPLTNSLRALGLGRCGLCTQVQRATGWAGTWRCEPGLKANELAGKYLALQLVNEFHRCSGFSERR